MSQQNQLTESLFLRLPKSEIDRLESIVSKFPLVKKTTLARECLRMGLDLISANPGVLLGEESEGQS